MWQLLGICNMFQQAIPQQLIVRYLVSYRNEFSNYENLAMTNQSECHHSSHYCEANLVVSNQSSIVLLDSHFWIAAIRTVPLANHLLFTKKKHSQLVIFGYILHVY